MALKKINEATALRAVGPRAYVRDTAGLVAQLGDADPTARRWAARDLASHPEATAALCAHLEEEADLSVRSALFTSLSTIGGPEVAETLIGLLRTEDAGLRNGAIEVLAGLPDVVAPRIEALLHDADGDVRIFTVNLLGELKHPRVPTWLTQVLLEDSAVNVVGAALEVLTEVATVESLPVLKATRSRFADDAYIGFAVDLAIDRIGAG
jgi:HEAT repeat protein